jgi:uncharacterized protein YcaQ
MWLSGSLSVSHRDSFIKYYDLTERVIPACHREHRLDERTQVNGLCEQALQRLGFASAIEIQRFWDACELSEVHDWLQKPSMPHRNLRACGQTPVWLPCVPDAGS